jgi:hypothetical protein
MHGCQVHGDRAVHIRLSDGRPVYFCGFCDEPAEWFEVVPQGVAEKLATQLRYAVDALEGKPWTGWTTDDAHAVLAAYPREETTG